MSVTDALDAAVTAGRLQPDPAQRAAAERLSALARDIARWKGGGARLVPRPAPRGVYLWGGVGTGKSLMMDLFFETAPIAARRRVHFHHFLQELQARITAERARKQSDPLPRVAKAIARETRLLCFDELQVTDVGDAMVLGRLIDHLFAAGVVLVATSNRAPDELYKGGINRQLFLPFIAAIKAKLDVIRLDSGRDYRLERLEAAPVYYTPLGPEADAAMDAAFERLTLGAQPRRDALSVNGRTLEVARAAAGVARFSFEDLCARALGPADYLAIAERFHTVMIDHAPLLGPRKRDQAKRFATLVDALYEARAKLVMSAGAEPHALYTEGDYAFEFQRTASRLMEMRSHDYLAAERRTVQSSASSSS
ncbi:AFG1 family ATPase [Alkalicaulis satelles]|uniref:AFG1 family ATPase n=1 Tax=Alkalicaulis satelles TaxID=2609175 RepID=A0A5M6ZKK1_9PROT|nr:cell division protein ZapE [Alkalicaulis satelles]KAA5803748.1 AFG1 family ATPase [Alkalicaulis satelles]